MTAAPKLEVQSKVHPKHEDVILVDQADPMLVLDLVNNQKMKGVIQTQSVHYQSELAFAELLKNRPHQFFRNPMRAYLGHDKAYDLRIIASSFETKQKVLEPLTVFLQELRSSRAIRDEAILIADELFTNGIKNAWPTSNMPFLQRKPGEVDFQVCATEDKLVIICRDSFGSLDSSLVLKKIAKVYEKGVGNSINMGAGGAGIGSYLIFNSSISYFLGVDPGRCSIVGCVLPLGLKQKQIVDLPKNLHILNLC